MKDTLMQSSKGKETHKRDNALYTSSTNNKGMCDINYNTISSHIEYKVHLKARRGKKWTKITVNNIFNKSAQGKNMRAWCSPEDKQKKNTTRIKAL